MPRQKFDVQEVTNGSIEEFCTIPVAAARIGVSEVTFYKALEQGIIFAYSVLGQTVVKHADLDNWTPKSTVHLKQPLPVKRYLVREVPVSDYTSVSAAADYLDMEEAEVRGLIARGDLPNCEAMLTSRAALIAFKTKRMEQLRLRNATRAAAYIGCDDGSIWDAVQTGQLKTTEVGGRKLFAEADLDEYRVTRNGRHKNGKPKKMAPRRSPSASPERHVAVQ